MPDHDEGFSWLARRGRVHGADAVWERAGQSLATAGRPTGRQRLAMAAAALVVVVAAIIGIGIVFDEDTVDVATDGASGAEPGSWVALLADVPASSGPISVTVRDFERAREQRGIDVPGPQAADDEVERYVDIVESPDAFRVLFNATPSEMRAELGFDQRHVDQAVWFGDEQLGPFPDLVMRGRFDTDSIDAAVRADPVWGGDLVDRTHSGVDYYAWGDDGRIDISRQTPVRPVGQGQQLAVIDGDRVVWTVEDEVMRTTLDAIAGSGPSVIELPGVLPAAEIADGLGLTLGLFQTASTTGGDSGGEATFGSPDILVMGTADESSLDTVDHVVIVYPTEAEADTQVDALRAAFSEYADSLPGVTTTVERDGAAVVAGLTGVAAGTRPPMFLRFEGGSASGSEVPDASEGPETYGPYLAAWEAFEQCLADGDADIFAVRFLESDLRYEYGFTDGSVRAHDACYDEHLSAADTAHQMRMRED